MEFLDDDRFDVDAFRHTVEMVFTAQEILVGRADYPTEQIAENAHDFRQLGLGYTNLGALLMALGLPYDSVAGRAWAAAITSLMTGHAYATSARTAARMGPFARLRRQRGAHAARPAHAPRRQPSTSRASTPCRPYVVRAAQQAWETPSATARSTACATRRPRSWRPTGTISFMLDCDTTGVEPDLSLVKSKKLVGGGTMSIVNQTVPRALRHLGYDDAQIADIVAYIDAEKSIVGAPHLSADHLPVFACSMGDNPIHYEGHVRMLAAVQPFLSGAVSKTTNMPEDVTVEEVEHLHQLAWELGLKSIAIYRDNCKVGQPLSTTKKAVSAAPTVSTGTTTLVAESGATQIVERIVEKVVHRPVREKLPRSRKGRTFEFRVADCKGFATIGEYDDGRPGEVFLTVSKQGSTLAGIMDAFAKSISYGLQYGVPLRAFVEAFTNMRFEPAGMTDDPEIRFASSVMDYLFRKLAMEYMTYEERAELSIFSVSERMQPTLPGLEETVVETSSGSEMVADPKSLPSAGDLADQLSAGVAAPVPLDNTPAAGRASASPTPRCACSAAWRWSAPAPATPARAAARRAAAAERPPNWATRRGRFPDANVHSTGGRDVAQSNSQPRWSPGGRPGSMNHSVPNDVGEPLLGHRQHRSGVARLAGMARQRPSLALDEVGHVDGVVDLDLRRAERVAVVGRTVGVPLLAAFGDRERTHRVAAERRFEDPGVPARAAARWPTRCAWTWSGWP